MSARNRNWLMTLSLVIVLSEAIADDVTQNAASGPRCGDGTPRGDSFCAADEHAALTEQLEELHKAVLSSIKGPQAHRRFQSDIAAWKKKTTMTCRKESKQYEGAGNNVDWVSSNLECLTRLTRLRIVAMKSILETRGS